MRTYQEEIDYTEAALPDVDPLFRAKFVCDVGEVTADEGKGNDEAVLGWKFETHLEMVLEELRIKAEEGEARGVRDEILEAIHHSRVECDGVQQRRDILEGVEKTAVFAA